MKNSFRIATLVFLAIGLAASSAGRRFLAAEPTATPPIETGLRVASAGHSFHMFVPRLLSKHAADAKIENHKQVATQGIGGSYVYQHWDRADDQNAIKKALKAGEVDVLTLSPIYLPDDGIENFARLGLEHNPDIRITIQEFWLPYDVYARDYKKKRPEAVDRNARTAAEIHEQHDAYFKDMDAHVRELNEKFGKEVIYVVPAGQAAVLLREKIIAGEAPGLDEQNDLFTDAIGHATPPLAELVGYCHFAVIYRRSPVGLPVPQSLMQGKYKDHAEALNTLLQELAWQAVRAHPLGGVK